jgi:hypothetical protein
VSAGEIDGAQDPRLVASIRQALFGEAKPGRAEQGQGLLDASPQLQDLLAELRLRESATREITPRRRRAQPATRGRASDAEVRGGGDVAGAADEMPKPVVVPPLRAGRGRT